LPEYDYSRSGAYFLTLCTHSRLNLFGDVRDGIMHHNTLGQVVAEEWERSAAMRQEITLDAWVIMPNHMHGIVIITAKATDGDVTSHQAHAPTIRTPGPKPRSVGALVGGFKSAVTKRINSRPDAHPMPTIWQRNYWEHIVRDDQDLERIREYIRTNPQRWTHDALFR
jgi:putative transposase